MDPDKKAGRWSLKYAIVKFLAKTAFYIFYRRVYVRGLENVPGDGGLIFAANHQNALMDALAVILTGRYQPVYLARADIFRNPLIARILKFLKILPVYRFRDGVGSMGQNEDTFKKTSAILAEGGCIGIMPEGNHGERKRLRTLKKGIFRIAFKAVESDDGPPDVKVVPVGLEFSNTTRIFEELAVSYGKPLSVSDYLDLYEEHPQKGINTMRKDLSESMASLMINISDESNYKKDKLLLDIGSQALKKELPGINARTLHSSLVSVEFCRAMYEYFEMEPDKADRLREKSDSLSGLIEKYGFSPGSFKIMNKPEVMLSFASRIFCYPLFLAGFTLHIIPYLIIRMALKKLKDPQFISSFKFVLGLILIPLNYSLLAVLLFSSLPVMPAIMLLAAVPLTGFLAYRCFRQSQKLAEIMHFSRICNSDNELAGNVFGLRSQIIEALSPVFKLTEEKLK